MFKIYGTTGQVLSQGTDIMDMLNMKALSLMVEKLRSMLKFFDRQTYGLLKGTPPSGVALSRHVFVKPGCLWRQQSKKNSKNHQVVHFDPAPNLWACDAS